MSKTDTEWGPSPWAVRLRVCQPWRLRYLDRLLHIDQGRRQHAFPLWQLTELRVTTRFAWRTCRLEFSPTPAEGALPQVLILSGLARTDAHGLNMSLRDLLQGLVGEELESLAPAMEHWESSAYEALEASGWFRQSATDTLIHQRDTLRSAATGMPARTPLDNPLVGKLDMLPLSAEVSATTSRIFSDAFTKDVESHNAKWSEHEIERHDSFFSSVEPHPLTEEQARAAVCFNDRVRLIAAAGSGKTSTMVARAGYAVLAGHARPEEIVLLAFNADAAQELRDRIRDKLAPWVENADNIEVSTFHAFGLKIIGQATGRKPTVPSWLNDGQDHGAVVRIVNDLMRNDQSFRAAVGLFAVVLREDLGPFKDLPQRSRARAGDPLVDAKDERIVTLRGEVVKSQEEKALADWLLFHGIDYEYERPYHQETADAEHSQYHPDFYYPAVDLYHEHLALDEHGNPPPHFEGYAEGVEWKRELHRRGGNRYMETTSHQIRNGSAFDHLKATLENYGLQPEPSLDNLVDQVQPMPVPELAKLIRTFMQHYKANGHTLAGIRERARSQQLFIFRVELFLRIFEPVLNAWNQRLQDEGAVDFDDMLNHAAEHIEGGEWQSPYCVVAVDEWQDTSAARARIVKAMNAQGASLFTVGDDYQAINAFSGADVRFMTEFEQQVGKGTTLFLTETFRCPQSLNDMATSFVMANPAQIPKQVRTHNPLEGRSIRVVAHPKGELEDYLSNELQRLAAHAGQQGESFEVLLIGRYRHDAPESLHEYQRVGSPNLEVRFCTVHQSKGLEADYVFLLNVHQGASGFPSQKQDDSLISLVMPDRDPFPHAEERRLFYVALTRAKRRVVIFAEEDRLSRFVTELEDYGLPPVRRADGSPLRRCPRCEEGMLRLRPGRKGRFWGCSRFPKCRHTESHTED